MAPNKKAASPEKKATTEKAAPAKAAPAKKPAAKVVNVSAEDKKSAESVADYLAEMRKLGIIGDVNKKINFISTGNWIIDRLLGDGTGTSSPGGIPRGAFVEIFGNESCGKTTLALHCAKSVQDQGGVVVFVDYERTLRFQQHYIKALGINTDPSKFIVLEPDNFEQGNMALGKVIMMVKPQLVIVDSWAAAVPQAAMDGGADEGTRMGLHANITSQVLPRFAKWIKASDTAYIILNQLRKNIKASKYDPGPDEITTGGNAIKFYPTIRIEMRTQSKETVEKKGASLTGADEKKAVSQVVKVVVVKNKMDIPWKSSPIYITFGQGINGIRSLIELAVNRKVINKAGSRFEYKSPTNPGCSFNFAGMQQVQAYLQEHPEVVQDMMPLLLPKVDGDELKAGIKRGFVEKGDLDGLDLKATFGDDVDEETLAELAALETAQSGVAAPGTASDLADI